MQFSPHMCQCAEKIKGGYGFNDVWVTRQRKALGNNYRGGGGGEGVIIPYGGTWAENALQWYCEAFVALGNCLSGVCLL